MTRRARLPAILLLFGAGAIIAATAVASAGGPTEYVVGDLTVSAGSPQVWTSRTVSLAGNVTIEAGGRLTLVNSTLLLALPANGSFAVVVRGAGTLELLDADALPSTAFDRSSLASASPDRRYTLTFEAGSNVLVRGSEVRDFGYSSAIPGMLVQSSNVTFRGASLGPYAFLKVEAASPQFEAVAFDGGGQGSNYFYASDTLLLNCTFTAHLVAVAALQGSSLTLEGALMRDLPFALALNGSTVVAANTTLVNSSQGLFLTNASLAVLTDADLGGAPVAFGDNSSELRSYRAFAALVLNQASDPVRGADVEFRDGNGTLKASGQTNSAGVFGPTPLLAYNETAAGQVEAANYSARAARAGNQTQVGFSARTESPQLTLSILANLDPTITLVRPAPGSTLLENVVATFEATVSDPDATAGGLTVAWRDSLLGLMGTGAVAAFSLPVGNRTVTVEAADTDGGFRALSFVVDVVPPTTQTFSDAGSPPGAWFVVAKAPTGAFLLTPSAGTASPPLAVGAVWEIRPATGTVVWSNGTVTLAYSASLLPYGMNETGLVLARFNGTAWVVVPGSVQDGAAHTVRATVTPSLGLGEFAVLATEVNAVAPMIDPIPRLIAVHGQPFSFAVTASDTPGQSIVFALVEAPAWVQVDPDQGTISGVAPTTERGLLRFNVTATDSTLLTTPAPVELFVTSTLENAPPRLVNPLVVPARPVAGTEVTVQVTYFDAEDDRPTVVELLVDGSPVLMDALDARDIYWLDGKAYVARVMLAPGPHNLSFRTNDGAPGHGDVLLAGPPIEAAGDSVSALNNAFLSLFLSAALTFAFIVWLATARREPKEVRKPPAPEPEDEVPFLEGKALRPIEPQAPLAAEPSKGKEEELEEKADTAAKRAARIADEVDSALEPPKRL